MSRRFDWAVYGKKAVMKVFGWMRFKTKRKRIEVEYEKIDLIF